MLLSYYVKIELLWGSRCAHSPQVLQSLCLSPIILPTNHFNTAGAASIGPWTSCGSTPWGLARLKGPGLAVLGKRNNENHPTNQKLQTSNRHSDVRICLFSVGLAGFWSDLWRLYLKNMEYNWPPIHHMYRPFLMVVHFRSSWNFGSSKKSVCHLYLGF